MLRRLNCDHVIRLDQDLSLYVILNPFDVIFIDGASVTILGKMCHLKCLTSLQIVQLIAGALYFGLAENGVPTLVSCITC